MKTFGGLFKESLKEYGDKFIPILKIFVVSYLFIAFLGAIMLLLFIPIFWLGEIVNLFTFRGNFSDLIKNSLGQGEGFFSIYGLLFLIIFLVILLVIVFAQASYFYIALSKKKNPLLREIFNNAKKYFWKYIALSIVLSFFLFFLYLALIIPGIIFSVYWIFAFYILISENKGIMDSLRRSKEIVKGRWWKVFGFLALMVLIIFGTSFILAFIPFIGQIFSSLVITPFAILFFKNFYIEMKNLKISKRKK